jgi:hypothetical protein
MRPFNYFHRQITPGWWNPDKLVRFVMEDGRVFVTNEVGNMTFCGTPWLYEKCWERGWFVEAQE